MQHSGRPEQLPRGHRREKPLWVVNPQRRLSRHAWRLLEERRRRDSRGHGGVHRVEGLRGGVVAESLEDPARNHAGSHFYYEDVFEEIKVCVVCVFFSLSCSCCSQVW